MDKKFGFIGTGNMASVLIIGLIDSNFIKAENITCSDVLDEQLDKIKGIGVKTTKNNLEVVENSNVIFLCVKPNLISTVLEEIKNTVNKDKLIISIASGVKLSTLEVVDARIVRVMPNICCFVKETAAGFSMGKNTTEEDKKIVEEIFNSVGIAIAFDEDKLDAVTGLSGSGPAYFAFFIDSLAKAAEEEGLDRKSALKLASQTAIGTGKLILDSGMDPEEIIKRVSSPNGITVEGFKVLNNSNIVDILKETVKAAIRRSKELSK